MDNSLDPGGKFGCAGSASSGLGSDTSSSTDIDRSPTRTTLINNYMPFLGKTLMDN